ncbi:MAG: glycosyltransferase family 2 protein [Candidatus Hodarchaeota archaeon]
MVDIINGHYDSPKVSVVMSVHNGEKYVGDAIESILNQTSTNFEFVIINDGSIDKTKDILNSYRDFRIKVYHQEHMGLTKSLNKAIKLSIGKYIARMDADDIALPKRIEKQYQFLKEHKDTVCCSSWYYLINDDDDVIKKCKLPITHERIVGKMLFYNPLIHPGAMMHKEPMLRLGLYNESYIYSQDLELWFRMIAHGYKLSNIPEYLMKLRVHSDKIGLKKESEQKKTHPLLIKNAIKNGTYSSLAYGPYIYRLFSAYIPKEILIAKRRFFSRLLKY